jgi:hypothetical protein
MQTRKVGRPSKGARGASKVRFPLDQQAVYEAAAIEAGLPFSDYVVMKMAQLHAAEATSAAERRLFAQPDYITKALRAHQEAKAQEEAYLLDYNQMLRGPSVRRAPHNQNLRALLAGDRAKACQLRPMRGRSAVSTVTHESAISEITSPARCAPPRRVALQPRSDSQRKQLAMKPTDAIWLPTVGLRGTHRRRLDSDVGLPNPRRRGDSC